MTQQPSPSQDKVTPAVHRNVEQRCLFSKGWSAYDVTNLSKVNHAVGRNETLVFRARSSPDARADSIQLAPKLNATRVEIEEFRLTFTQEKVTLKAMTSRSVDQETLAKFLTSEDRLFIQTSKEILQPSQLLQKMPSVAKKSRIDSVPSKFIGIAVKVEGVIHK